MRRNPARAPQARSQVGPGRCLNPQAPSRAAISAENRRLSCASLPQSCANRPILRHRDRPRSIAQVGRTRDACGPGRLDQARRGRDRPQHPGDAGRAAGRRAGAGDPRRRREGGARQALRRLHRGGGRAGARRRPGAEARAELRPPGLRARGLRDDHRGEHARGDAERRPLRRADRHDRRLRADRDRERRALPHGQPQPRHAREPPGGRVQGRLRRRLLPALGGRELPPARGALRARAGERAARGGRTPRLPGALRRARRRRCS